MPPSTQALTAQGLLVGAERALVHAYWQAATASSLAEGVAGGVLEDGPRD